MDDSATLRGTELRYALTMFLLQHGPTSITDLIAGLTEQGFAIVGHPPKSVSDALRWEIQHGRVFKRRRAVYAAWDDIPRATEYRIHNRVLSLREQPAKFAQRRATRSMTWEPRPPDGATSNTRACRICR